MTIGNAIGKRGGCGFVDQSQNFQAGELRGFGGRVALRFAEIRGNRDHDAVGAFAQRVFGFLHHFSQDEAGHKFGRVLVVADTDAMIFGAHETLGELHDVTRICQRALQRDFAHDIMRRVEKNRRRRRIAPVGVFQHDRLAIFVDASHSRVCRAQINTQNATHNHTSQMKSKACGHNIKS